MNNTFVSAVVVLIILGGACPAPAAEKIDFARDIKPILELSCLKCHGTEQSKGGLRLHTMAAALKGGDSEKPAFVPGKPDQSPMYTSLLLPADDEKKMPPKKENLSKKEIDLLRDWIAQGADWPAGVQMAAIRRIDFEKDIQPLLEFNCVSCHHEGHAKGELRLDNRGGAFKGGESGPGIVPGDTLKSLVLTSTTLPSDDEKLMPPKNKGGPLLKEEIDLLRQWITQGASWPEEIQLTQKKKEEAGGDEVANVAAIHKLIMSKSPALTEAQMKTYTNTVPGSRTPYTMVAIRSGEFLMGSPTAEAGRGDDEGPQHKVKISPFWMGQCEVTWNEYEMFMFPDQERKFKDEIATDPYVDKISDAVARPTKPYVEMSFGMGKDGYPAISMTQHAANKYCEWLSAKTGEFYRLPTEAEWEYACRAGTTSAYFFGNDASQLGQYAWFEKNSDFKYQKVGRKKPNPWGLYDMHGNVAEWCLDQYYPNFEKLLSMVQDPWEKQTTPYPQVARGGSWDDTADKLRSSARRGSDKSWKQQDPQLPKSIWFLTDAQFIGFRIVRPLKIPSADEMQRYWNNGVEREENARSNE
jgi:formylglycine-generating enzyme required for sulfatase activity